MALPVPNLDDRTFQDLVSEARSRIPLHCPEWTDHNLSDPGIALIELFAWMTELIIYRLNKVPDKNYVKFLELIGVRLAPANPATTVISFRLTAPRETDTNIPRGTEVATVRTENEEAIIFSTDEDLEIRSSSIDFFMLSGDGSQMDDRPELLNTSDEVAAAGANLFAGVPEPGNAFYLGFINDVSSATLALTVRCDRLEDEGPLLGFNPSNPPLLWEYWDHSVGDWVAFTKEPDSPSYLESDGTSGLIQTGQIILHIPRTAGRTTVGLREGFWIRCLVTPFTEEQGSYYTSPRARSLESHAVGGTVQASNANRVLGEVLGISDGKSGQVMRVAELPMLPLGHDETVELEGEDDTGWEAWTHVEDFSKSGPEDRHFVCDPVAGEIQFGPVIRSPQGEDTRYGATPPIGRHVRLNSYLYGGGYRGNVGQSTLTVLKSSIPYVASVTNLRAASGGVESENVESAKIRGPEALRTRNRAVTADDFEYLARETSPSVGRACCVQPQQVGSGDSPLPGLVQVLLIPALSEERQRPDATELNVPRELLNEVKEYLDERRLLTTALIVAEPDYAWVSVEARVKVRRGGDPNVVRQAVEDALYRFIHPLFGGAEGNGWPFGRNLFVSELFSQIQAVPGVEYTEGLRVFQVNPVTSEATEVPQVLSVPATGVLCSFAHQVICS